MPESGNVEDRRGDGGGFGGGGGMGGMPIGAGGLGIGGMVVLGLIGWALGIDPCMLINGANVVLGDRGGYEQPNARRSSRIRARRTGTPSDEAGRFVARILGSTEVQWKDIFSKDGQTYRPPRLVMFSGQTRSACGLAQSAMGPFYCPNDREVYLDTAFFHELETRFRGCSGKACEFAQAYVIAHEVGHHVQNLLGILPKVQQAQQRVRQPRRIQPHPGAGRTAGRLLRRRLGEPRRGAKVIPRSRRHRRRAADRVRHRRRHLAEEGAGTSGAGQLHPRLAPSSASAGSRPASRKAP